MNPSMKNRQPILFALLILTVLLATSSFGQDPQLDVSAQYQIFDEQGLVLFETEHDIFIHFRCGWRQGRGGPPDESYYVSCPFDAIAPKGSSSNSKFNFAGPELKGVLDLNYTDPDFEGKKILLKINTDKKIDCEGFDLFRSTCVDENGRSVFSDDSSEKIPFQECVVNVPKSYFHNFLYPEKRMKSYVVRGNIVQTTGTETYVGKEMYMLGRFNGQKKIAGWLVEKDIKCKE